MGIRYANYSPEQEAADAVLCANCGQAKRRHGILRPTCPQMERAETVFLATPDPRP